MEAEARAWHIGEHGEIYGARSEEEVKKYYVSLVGEEEAKEHFESCFDEITGDALDAEFTMNSDEDPVIAPPYKTTWRKELADHDLPTQLSTSYV